MEGHAYLGELLGGLIYLIAGFRLLRLGGRTGEAPERLLGAIFLLMGVSAVLYVLPSWPVFAALWTPLNFAGRLAFMPPSVMIVIFTWLVFRPEARWPIWFAWITAALIATGIGGTVWVGDWEGYSIDNHWFWLEWLGYTLPFGWAGTEAFLQHLQARRRLRLGLSERMVCNRLLLWSGFGVLQVCSCLVLIPQYAQYGRDNLFTATWDMLYGAFVIGSLAMIWLVFFPPVVYRRWISGGAGATPAPAEEG
jgi:hypothetical protein